MNYPNGTSPNDKTAPWNQDHTEPPECHQCGGTGYQEQDDENKCKFCKGTGYELDDN